MEPDIMPLHPSTPPPLDDDGDGETESDEDEFGDFGGFALGVSCSPLSFADSTDSSSSLRQPSSTVKPATHQPNSSFNHPVKQSQPTSAVNSGSDGGQIDAEGQDHSAESGVHLTNGYSERSDIASADSTEQWDGRAAGTNSSNRLGDVEQEAIMDSEPRPYCANKAKEKVSTTVEHCEKRDVAPALPSQDHRQPQEAAGALELPAEEGSGASQRERRPSLNSVQTTDVQQDGDSDEDRDDQEMSFSNAPQTFSVYESASEDLPSFCDDLSFEGPSVEVEPNVSSLAFRRSNRLGPE
ncbi:hypothetical protein GBF38_002519 [Nibea albiflora]|uniref:Uncharacterized protein n=1 Tax=Nibea albiflora TaxID=240163 RepID=A0ACB7EDX3_NIBAL|nr:hypothetical protein GBF38_002519 [Nibea albiflora]